MDNHAISLAFDNLNNAYEAEMARDEKQQEQELAALLQQEFNDFDFDEEEDDDEDEGVAEEDEEIEEITERKDAVEMNSSCSASDGEEDGDDEEEEDDEDEDDEDEVKSRLSLTPLPSVNELRPLPRDWSTPLAVSSLPDTENQPRERPRDWSTPLAVSSLPDTEMQPRERTPAASEPPDPPLTAFPPGPPSTDTSEVFGPRTGHVRLHPTPFEGSAPALRASNPSSFLTGRLSSLSSHPPPKSTRDVGVEAVPVGQRELDQLEILYQARGRRIEELQAEVLKLKEEQARELRVLKHRLSLAEGERNGARMSHQETQRHLVTAKEERDHLHSEMREQQRILEDLTSERAELSERLRNAEMTVEALNGQLVEMNTSEALRRAKEQQNNVMASLKLKHDREVVELRESVDLTRRDLEAREDALRETRARADLLEREKRDQAAEHAENVSRMVKQLDELQARYRDAMSSVSAEEVKNLKAQVEEMTARKNITDSVNRALQDEAKELKEQLSMYENAHRLGLGGPMVTSSPAPKAESSDVSTHSLPSAASPVSTTASLKRELERCLVNYRAKRQQASELQEQLFEVKKERQELRSKLEKTESHNREIQQRLSTVQTEVEDLRLKSSGQSPEMIQMRRDLEKVKMEKDAAEEGREEAQKRMEEVLVSEGRLSELNEELQRQISQIFRDFDADKRESLDRVQQTWEQHLEQSKTTLRDELTREFGSERLRLVAECDARVNATELRLKSANEELDRVKSEFVALAELRSQEETALTRRREEEEEALVRRRKEEEEAKTATECRMKAEMEERLRRAEEEWRTEKDTEVLSRLQLQREELEAERERQVEETRRQMKEEFDQRLSVSEREWQRKMEEIRLKHEAAEKLRDTLSSELVKVRSDHQSELNLASSLEQQRWTELEVELRRQVELLEAERDLARQEGEKEQRERETVELELRRRVDTLEAALTEARRPTSPVGSGEKLRLATLEAALAEECRRSRENLHRHQTKAGEMEETLRRRVEELEAVQRTEEALRRRLEELEASQGTEEALRRRVEELEAIQRTEETLRRRVEELEAGHRTEEALRRRVEELEAIQRTEKALRRRVEDLEAGQRTEEALRRRVEELEAIQRTEEALRKRVEELEANQRTEEVHRRRLKELETGQRTEEDMRRRVETEDGKEVDWEHRVKEMKRRLEREFRARFHEYRAKRDAELADAQYRLDRERLMRVTRWQDSRHFGCQTESSASSSVSDSAAVTRMREQFVEALSRIRGEVLAHVSMSRTRAALALQTELGRSQHRACLRLADSFRTAVIQLEADGDSVSRSEVVRTLDLCLSLSRSAVNSSSSSSDVNTTRSCSFLFPPASDRTSDQSFLSGISLPVASLYEPLKAFRRTTAMSKSVEEKENCLPLFETRRST